MLKGNRQSIQAAQAQIRAPGERARLQLQIGHPPQHALKGGLTLYAGQGRSKAEMTCPGKGHVTVVLPPQVQAIGIGKALRVAVRRAHYGDHRLPLADCFVAQRHISRRQPRRLLARAFVAQQFLDSGGQQTRICSQPSQFRRVPQQRQQPVADQVGGG